MENLIEYFNVDIYCDSVSNHYVRTIECNCMMDVSRLLLKFKPKRGYKVVKVVIEERVKFL